MRGHMSRTTANSLKSFIIGMVILLMLSSCASDLSSAATPAPVGTYPVESIFREFYNMLGGTDTLGYAISPMVEYGSIKMQYTEAALMQYDLTAPASQKYSLAPLGLELKLSDQPIVRFGS